VSDGDWAGTQAVRITPKLDMVLSHKIERVFIVVGVALCAIYAFAHVYRIFSSHIGRVALESARRANDGSSRGSGIGAVDFTAWSEKRVKAYEETFAKHFDPPLGLLDIPKLHLKVSVFNGTDDVTLDRGVGRIIGTGHLGEEGNIGIAGHRDGFFRALKDIQVGDAVDLTTADTDPAYVVDHISIVNPDNVQILDERALPTLTLVTCYPFYFIGSAPQRYVIQCSLKDGARLRKRSH
jgi:sortase A